MLGGGVKWERGREVGLDRRIWIGTDPFLQSGILFGVAHIEVKGLEKRICDLIKDLYPSL